MLIYYIASYVIIVSSSVSVPLYTVLDLQVEADGDETDNGSFYDLFPEARPWIPIAETTV